MRWQAIALAAVSVGALYGFAYLAVERKIAPLAEQASSERAAAEARVAALEVERAWIRSRRAFETAARALARSPVLATAAEELPAHERGAALEAALENAVEQSGGRGRAALVEPDGTALAGAAPLGETAAARAARSGALGLRVERVGDEVHEVVALPVGDPREGEAIRAALVLARPLGRTRLGAWTRSLPASTVVVILDGTEPVASLRPFEQVAAVRSKRLPPELDIVGVPHAVSEMRLPDDGGAELRVVTLAPLIRPGGGAALDAMRLLVLGLAGISFLLTTALILTAPGRSDGAKAQGVSPLGEADRVDDPPTLEGPDPRSSGRFATGRGVFGASPGSSGVFAAEAREPARGGDPLDPGRGSAPAPRAAWSDAASSGVHQSGVHQPGVHQPGVHQSGVHQPGVHQSGVHQPGVHQSEVHQPGVHQSGVHQPGVHQSGVHQPGVHQPGQGARPDAAGTYSGVPAGVADTLPGSAVDLDATPHSSGAYDPVPAMPEEDPLPLYGRSPGSSGSFAAPRPGPASSGAFPPASPRRSESLPPGRSSASVPRATPGALAGERGPSAAGDRPEPPAPYARRPESAFGDRGPEALGLGSAAGVPSSGAARPAEPPAADEGRPPAPPPPSNPAHEAAPSFDAIARAARTAPPAAAPSPDENLPAPKGGLSPGMVAGQGLVSHGRVMAPSPRHEGNLPIPKNLASHLNDPAPESPSSVLPPTGNRTGPRGAPGLASGVSTGLSSPHLNAVTQPPGRTGDLAQPFDAQHYRRVFDEFVEAKSRIGESVEGLTFESFGAKLRASEEGLIQRHACRAVRFEVLVKDRSVSLRPQLVRSSDARSSGG